MQDRQDGALEDDRIADFLRPATAKLDGRDGLLGRCLITQRLRLALDGFPPSVALPLPPCQAVLAVRYVDPAGTQQTWRRQYQVFTDAVGR